MTGQFKTIRLIGQNRGMRGGMMTFLIRFSLKNAAAVFVCSFLLMFLGLYSFSSLKVDLLPNIEFPQLSIEVVYPGASPQDVNEEVTAKLEEKLKSLDGLKQMQSSSYEGMAVMNLEFPFRTDIMTAFATVTALIPLALTNEAGTLISKWPSRSSVA